MMAPTVQWKRLWKREKECEGQPRRVAEGMPGVEGVLSVQALQAARILNHVSCLARGNLARRALKQRRGDRGAFGSDGAARAHCGRRVMVKGFHADNASTRMQQES